MPIPFILGGIAIASAVAGVKKGVDAKNDFDLAKSIGEDAKDDFRLAQSKLEKNREKLNDGFKSFAEFKISIFQNEIKSLVDVINKYKDSKSAVNIEKNFSQEEINEISGKVQSSMTFIDLVKTGTSSISAGALTAFGAYGTAGVLATASTGTAISTLSGAAATNATLAWFGGGSLAAGGFGIAGGTAVLGGIVAGPAIAVMGFMAAAKADEAYTEACRYRSKVEKEVEKIDVAIELMNQVQRRIDELSGIIVKLKNRFNQVYTDNIDDDNFNTMLAIGKSLKNALEIAVLDKDGDLKINKNISSEIRSLEV